MLILPAALSHHGLMASYSSAEGSQDKENEVLISSSSCLVCCGLSKVIPGMLQANVCYIETSFFAFTINTDFKILTRSSFVEFQWEQSSGKEHPFPETSNKIRKRKKYDRMNTNLQQTAAQKDLALFADVWYVKSSRN